MPKESPTEIDSDESPDWINARGNTRIVAKEITGRDKFKLEERDGAAGRWLEIDDQHLFGLGLMR